MADRADPPRFDGPWSMPRLRRGLVTPELVSGTVLVSVVIAVSDVSGRSLDTMGITIVSMLVLWLSQVYIVAIAVQGTRAESEPIRVRESIRFAFGRAVGLLYATIPPLIPLGLGVLGVLDAEVAYWSALWMGVLVLAVLGWIAFASRRAAWYWRLGGACATAALGLLIILLRIFIK
ncbi:hypothetical protein ACFWGP_01955 [Agromyces sp. NPDC127015]|uniref:hypothetical protein n=1 Tax=Agromyces sp. NPDC127015 TaxID=3347108 RepID=UPI00366391C5